MQSHYWKFIEIIETQKKFAAQQIWTLGWLLPFFFPVSSENPNYT